MHKHTKRQLAIIRVLKHNDHKGVPFVETKEQLLKDGYSENEIIYCLYSASYDGKPNKPKEENLAEEFYKNNPEKADKLAGSLLKDHKKKQFLAFFGHAVASRLYPSTHARYYHGTKASDMIGVPVFSLVLIIVILTVGIIKFDWPNYILNIFGALIALLFIYKIWRHFK